MPLPRRIATLGVALSAVAPLAARSAQPEKTGRPDHRMVIHVNSPTKEVMVEALHNAGNVIDHYRAQGGSAAIEIVANGRGVTMFVDGMSPVAKELADYHKRYPDVVFDACAISLAHTAKALGREMKVMADARTVPSGAVRILELERQGWAYLKP